MWEILQINGEWEEFFLQAEVRETGCYLKNEEERARAVLLSLVTGFPASQASWQRENEGVEEERGGLRE